MAQPVRNFAVSILFTRIVRLFESVVPRKFVLGFVPEFPSNFHASLDHAAIQFGLP